MWRGDIKCKYMVMFNLKNSARKGKASIWSMCNGSNVSTEVLEVHDPSKQLTWYWSSIYKKKAFEKEKYVDNKIITICISKAFAGSMIDHCLGVYRNYIPFDAKANSSSQAGAVHLTTIHGWLKPHCIDDHMDPNLQTNCYDGSTYQILHNAVMCYNFL